MDQIRVSKGMIYSLSQSIPVYGESEEGDVLSKRSDFLELLVYMRFFNSQHTHTHTHTRKCMDVHTHTSAITLDALDNRKQYQIFGPRLPPPSCPHHFQSHTHTQCILQKYRLQKYRVGLGINKPVANQARFHTGF